MPPCQPTATRVFVAYSHRDEKWCKQLDTHLSLLRRQGLIEEWHYRRIEAGQDWNEQIDTHLAAADIVLFLVSPDFIDSDYCYSIEMKHALKLHKMGRARVIPVILRFGEWEHAPFGKLQALPTNGKPITGRGWHNLDEAWTNVAKGLRQVVVGSHTADNASTPNTEEPTAKPVSAANEPLRITASDIENDASSKERDPHGTIREQSVQRQASIDWPVLASLTPLQISEWLLHNAAETSLHLIQMITQPESERPLQKVLRTSSVQTHERFKEGLLHALTDWNPHSHGLHILMALGLIAVDNRVTDATPLLQGKLDEARRSGHRIDEIQIAAECITGQIARFLPASQAHDALKRLYYSNSVSQSTAADILAALCKSDPHSYPQYIERFVVSIKDYPDQESIDNKLRKVAQSIPANILIDHLSELSPKTFTNLMHLLTEGIDPIYRIGSSGDQGFCLIDQRDIQYPIQKGHWSELSKIIYDQPTSKIITRLRTKVKGLESIEKNN